MTGASTAEIKTQQRLGANGVTRRKKKPAPANSNLPPLNICLGLSTSALFDMRALDEEFQKSVQTYVAQGMNINAARSKAGKDYEKLITEKRREHLLLTPGPAAILARKLLLLNGVAGINVNLRMISRNHPDVYGLVVDSHVSNPWLYDNRGLSLIKGASFYSGEPIKPVHVKGHKVDILLATNAEDVTSCLAAGIAAAKISHLAAHAAPDIDAVTLPLTIGFDFDRVLGFARHPTKNSQDAEDFFMQSMAKHGFEEGLKRYSQHMQQVGYEPAQITHLCEFLKKLYEVQNRVGKEKVKIRIVTARGTDAAPQIISTLEALGASGVELHCLAGASKEPFIRDTDIFFDDVPKNLIGAPLAAEVPYAAARTLARGGDKKPSRQRGGINVKRAQL